MQIGIHVVETCDGYGGSVAVNGRTVWQFNPHDNIFRNQEEFVLHCLREIGIELGDDR